MWAWTHTSVTQQATTLHVSPVISGFPLGQPTATKTEGLFGCRPHLATTTTLTPCNNVTTLQSTICGGGICGVAGCGTNQATLNSTAKAKSNLPLHSLMCLRVNRSNIVGKVRRQTAFEERGDAKLLRLFPKRHKPATGRAVEEEGARLRRHDTGEGLHSVARRRAAAEGTRACSGATLLTVNFRQPRVLVIHWFRL
jgi:hypothetical protein